jgi:hypothetical protein
MTRRRPIRLVLLLLFVSAVSPLARAQNAQGKVENATLNLPGVADYPFKRAPEPAAAAATAAKP